MERYKGKTAIITGGGGDIAEATCKRLLEEGANVVLTDFSSESLDQTLAKMQESGYGPDCVKAKTVNANLKL